MSIDIDYANLDFIPEGAAYPERWETDARAYREREAAIGRARLNEAYGAGDRQKMDLFYPAGKPKGLVVFVHGGYWMRFDRTVWSHFATGLTELGWVVAMPSYTLAPEARLGEITGEIAHAINHAAAKVQGPVRLIGHSAGGQLVARMGDASVALTDDARSRLAHILPVSPVSELRPLMDTAMNDTLRLDAGEAAAESPVLAAPPDVPVTVWVGAEERPVFLDQAIRLAEAWDAPLRMAPGRHHFDIVDGLLDAKSPMVRSLLEVGG
jgi:acetyl esterase/lipase